VAEAFTSSIKAFEPVLEFALDAGPGLQQRQVEGAHMHVLQRRRHIALGHAQGKALHHGGLAHAGLTGEDGVVLPAAGEDVDDLANLRVPAKDRVDLSLACVAGEVDGVLVEVGRLAAPGFTASPGVAGRRPCGRLTGKSNDAEQIFAQRVGVDLLELAANVVDQPGEFLVRDQREDREAGAHLAGVEVDGADRPRGGQHLEHGGADGRRAGVAGLQLVDAAGQIRGEPRFVYFKMLDDRGEVARSGIEQLGEVVFDLDVVVSAREAEAGCPLERQRAGSFSLPISAFRFIPI
jgi:hypothetical protein